MFEQSIGSPLLWGSFTALIAIFLLLDLGVFQRKNHEIKLAEALTWTVVWIVMALAFNLYLYLSFGQTKALEFLTGYLIEKALSVDNLFIFLVVFSAFKVAPELQHRVLFLGILGAIFFRAIFIAVGAVLLSKFAWIIYPFGLLLIWTAVRLIMHYNAPLEFKENIFVRLFKKIIPIDSAPHGARFFVRINGKLYGTSLLLALVTIEVTDIIFAIDSIPAIFAITDDPFIVYTSNIFAILGLRALYFALAGILQRFRFLKISLALILAFVGSKMLLHGIVKIPVVLSLSVVAGLLLAGIAASLLIKQRSERS